MLRCHRHCMDLIERAQLSAANLKAIIQHIKDRETLFDSNSVFPDRIVSPPLIGEVNIFNNNSIFFQYVVTPLTCFDRGKQWQRRFLSVFLKHNSAHVFGVSLSRIRSLPPQKIRSFSSGSSSNSSSVFVVDKVVVLR